MKILINPHIHRFHEICFDITFSSSLPPFPDGFHGTASILRYLKLDCIQDDGASLDILGSIASTELQFPALIRLAMDGRNYYNACKKDSRWTVKYQGVLDLAISHYTPLPSQSFPTSEFLLPITLMPNLRSLNMTDLILHSSTTYDIRGTWEHSPYLHLDNIRDFESITAIFDVLGSLTDATLTRCPIGDPTFYIDAGKLTLRDIDADQDLDSLLDLWEGDSLQVINCPSFNDMILDMMGDWYEETGHYSCASFAYSLEIQDCLHFSGAALRRLVAARLEVSGNGFTRVEISGRAPLFRLQRLLRCLQHGMSPTVACPSGIKSTSESRK
jgi:hypothetical protein